MDFSEWTINNWVRTPKQEEIHQALLGHRIALVAGANRSTKTKAICATEVEAMLGFLPQIATPPVHVMVVALDEKQAKGSLEEYFSEFIPDELICESNRERGLTTYRRLHLMECPRVGKRRCNCRGSELTIRTEHQGRRSFQGAQPHIIHINEEILETLWGELNARLRAGHKLRIWMDLCPLLGFTWVYHKLWKRKGNELDIGRVTTSIYDAGFPPCLTCQRGPGGAPAECPRCRGHGVEPFYPKEEIDQMIATCPEDQRDARIFGKWGGFGGLRLFSEKQIERWEAGLVAGTRDRIGCLRNGVRNPAHEYVLAADASYGIGGDNAAIVALDAISGEQVVEWADNSTPTAGVRDVMEVIRQEWGNPLTIGERQGPGEALLELLKESHRFRLYQQRFMEASGYDWRNRLGYWTSHIGRTRLLDRLATDLREGRVQVRFRKTLEELADMTWNEKAGRFEAVSGGKDDLAFAFALAAEAMRSRSFVERNTQGMGPITRYRYEQRMARLGDRRRVSAFPLYENFHRPQPKLNYRLQGTDQ